VRSMLSVTSMDMGFAIDNRMMLSTDVELGGLDREEGQRFYARLLEAARALPGVRAAGTARNVPLGFGSDGGSVHVEGQHGEGVEGVAVLNNVVSTDYFRTLGTPVLRGREFDDGDREDTAGVVIVNERFVERFFDGGEALGKRISDRGPNGPWLEIVGVVRSTQFLIPGETPRPLYFLPFSQRYRSQQTLHVWSEGPPEALVPALRQIVREHGPGMPVFDVRSMRTHIEQGKTSAIFGLGSGLVGAFGLIGMVLAGIGLYGVMAFSVGQRTRELGIRIALGASGGALLRQVLGHGFALALVGVALGLAAASVLTGMFAHLLVGVGPRDPATFAVVAVFLLGIALLASAVPAWRATRVDPMQSLRCD
jgi:putative ABC transport system permease protein